jgi:hypothetical protein
MNRALAAAEQIPPYEPLSEAFLNHYCGHTIEAVYKICKESPPIEDLSASGGSRYAGKDGALGRVAWTGIANGQTLEKCVYAFYIDFIHMQLGYAKLYNKFAFLRLNV